MGKMREIGNGRGNSLRRWKGNPNWTNPQMMVAAPAKPTQFELEVARLGLTDAPERWTRSLALRRWVSTNCTRVYVPEELLQAMNLDVGEADLYLDPRYGKLSFRGGAA